MNYFQIVLFSSSILIATVIGWVRFNKTGPAFLPFILCVSIATVNEIISFILTYNKLYTVVNNNVYVLFEALLITWQFKNWGLLNRHKYIFAATVFILCLAWYIEIFILSGIHAISSYFRILYALMVVLMSITLNNRLMLSVKNNLLKNPVFLICTGFIIFFTYKILVEEFWLYGLNASKDFRNNMYLVLTWINLIINLVYATAFLWIPKKPQYITLS